MGHRFNSLSGFVLAGGASRRMGLPKALLVLGNEAMVQRQIRLLRSLCRSVAVLGSPPLLVGLDAPVVPDEISGRGPLGGIYTGLQRTRTEYNLFLGCDLPFMKRQFLDYLCRKALESRADVTVPESSSGRIEPLCGVYRRRGLWAVRASLTAGENRITRFYPRVRVSVVPWRELARDGFGARIFDNMNTPEDFETAKRVLQ